MADFDIERVADLAGMDWHYVLEQDLKDHDARPDELADDQADEQWPQGPPPAIDWLAQHEGNAPFEMED